jgi:hypothetical protein
VQYALLLLLLPRRRRRRGRRRRRRQLRLRLRLRLLRRLRLRLFLLTTLVRESLDLGDVQRERVIANDRRLAVGHRVQRRAALGLGGVRLLRLVVDDVAVRESRVEVSVGRPRREERIGRGALDGAAAVALQYRNKHDKHDPKIRSTSSQIVVCVFVPDEFNCLLPDCNRSCIPIR